MITLLFAFFPVIVRRILSRVPAFAVVEFGRFDAIFPMLACFWEKKLLCAPPMMVLDSLQDKFLAPS
jgi:hypothetical protein